MKTKRAISLLLSILMLLSITAGMSFEAQAATNKTQDEAIEWCKGKVGKTVEYNDSKNYAQCVDFVQAYYNYLGKTPIYGSANTYITSSGAVPSGWQRITVKSNTALKKGDIAVYTPNTKTWAPTKYGHVAVIAKNVSASDTTFTVYQQNYCGQSYVSKNGGVPKSVLSCVIRPDFKTNITCTGTFNFNANGGSGSMSNITVKSGNNLTVPKCPFTRSGYTFAGWNAYRHSDGKWYTVSNKWQTASAIKSNGYTKKLYPDACSGAYNNSWFDSGKTSETYTFYAVWAPNKLTLRYNVNGGSISSSTYYANSSGNVCKYSTNAVLTSTWNYNVTYASGLYNASTFGLYRNGYTFKGWTTTKDGTNVFDQDDSTVTPTKINSNIKYGDVSQTLYAKWELISSPSQPVTPTPVDNPVLTGLNKIDGDWYYYDQNGNMQTGWVEFGKYWRYFEDDGVMATGLTKIDGSWHYFNASGIEQYGLQKFGSNWRYFDEYGDMETSWVMFGNKWRYFKENGIMAVGLTKIDDSWHYFNSSGIEQYGLQKFGNNWRHFDEFGEMSIGWVKFGSNYRYFQSNGIMLANCTKNIGGKNYKFNSSGICTNK